MTEEDHDDDNDTCLAHSNDADYNYDYNDYLNADANDDDDDDDNSYASYSISSEDEFNFYNNTPNPNVIFDMHGSQFTIDNNDNVVPYDNKPITLQGAQRQILLLVLSRNLPIKPNANTMSSSVPRRPLVKYP